MKHRIGLLWAWFVMAVTCWLPDAPVTMRLRGWLLGFLMKRRGKDFQVATHVKLSGLQNISVGDHVYLAPGVVILAGTEVELADEVMLAHYTMVTTSKHTLIDGSYRFGPTRQQPIRIGRGTWVAAHCTIVAGVEIGKGAIVAANAAVVEDVADGAMVGGVPARLIRTSGTDSKSKPIDATADGE